MINISILILFRSYIWCVRIANPNVVRPAPPIVKATALPNFDLVPRLSCTPCTKNSLVTIVDFLGPISNYHAGIRAGQLDCTEDNFSMGDTGMRAHSVTAALDPCSNLVKHDLLAYSESIRISPTIIIIIGLWSRTLMQYGRNSGSAGQACLIVDVRKYISVVV